MTKKTVIVFVTYFMILLSGVLSCTFCGPFPDRFKVVSLEGYIAEGQYNDTTNVSIKLMKSEINKDTINYNKFLIVLEPQIETYFTTITHPKSFSFIQSAYACSPSEPITDEKIDSIKIICDKDFDTVHKKGTDLAALFDVVVLDFVNDIYYEKFELSEYLLGHPAVPNELTLLLKYPPENSSKMQFMIKYYQDGIDHDYFEFITNIVVIKNY